VQEQVALMIPESLHVPAAQCIRWVAVDAQVSEQWSADT
jgi:hypothetical protein